MNMIACVGENGELGFGGDMPWKRDMPIDLKHFKEITLGSIIVMGRKTAESLKGPLKGRINVVITKNKEYEKEGFIIFNDMVFLNLFLRKMDKETFIIGGRSIYMEFLNRVENIYLTEIAYSFEADTFFPKFSKLNYEEEILKEHKKDEKNKYDCVFKVYKKRSLI